MKLQELRARAAVAEGVQPADIAAWFDWGGYRVWVRQPDGRTWRPATIVPRRTARGAYQDVIEASA